MADEEVAEATKRVHTPSRDIRDGDHVPISAAKVVVPIPVDQEKAQASSPSGSSEKEAI